MMKCIFMHFLKLDQLRLQDRPPPFCQRSNTGKHAQDIGLSGVGHRAKRLCLDFADIVFQPLSQRLSMGCFLVLGRFF
jgi:hypothetical protein